MAHHGVVDEKGGATAREKLAVAPKHEVLQAAIHVPAPLVQSSCGCAQHSQCANPLTVIMEGNVTSSFESAILRWNHEKSICRRTKYRLDVNLPECAVDSAETYL